MDKDQIIKELEALAQQARENKRHSESREMSARYQGEALEILKNTSSLSERSARLIAKQSYYFVGCHSLVSDHTAKRTLTGG